MQHLNITINNIHDLMDPIIEKYRTNLLIDIPKNDHTYNIFRVHLEREKTIFIIVSVVETKLTIFLKCVIHKIVYVIY